MIALNLYKGQVTGINDPEAKGKIQVRVLPELKDVREDFLPWLRPFSSIGATTGNMSFTTPKIGSNVWVIYTDKYFKRGYWVTGKILYGLFDYTSVKTKLSGIPELSILDYPNINFYQLSDEVILFFNTVTKDFGIRSASDIYTVFTSSGITYNFKGTKIVINDGTINLAGTTKHLTLFEDFKLLMQDIKLQYDTHIHTAPDGATTPPTVLLDILDIDDSKSNKLTTS